jgi:uncharacterized protein (DUF433 family)
MSEEKLLERIVSEPRVMLGKPVIRGTRLTVEYILKRLSGESTIDEILQEYPSLTRQDIKACMLFAAETVSSNHS